MRIHFLFAGWENALFWHGGENANAASLLWSRGAHVLTLLVVSTLDLVATETGV